MLNFSTICEASSFIWLTWSSIISCHHFLIQPHFLPTTKTSTHQCLHPYHLGSYCVRYNNRQLHKGEITHSNWFDHHLSKGFVQDTSTTTLAGKNCLLYKAFRNECMIVVCLCGTINHKNDK
jgi:hypothetical protein